MTDVILICLFLLGALTGQDLASARSLLKREPARLLTQAEQKL